MAVQLESKLTNYMEEGFIVSKDGDSDEVIHLPYNINKFIY